jgi:hypothetical protein
LIFPHRYAPLARDTKRRKGVVAMRIISERKPGIQSWRAHEFRYKNTPSAGFSFDIDESGNFVNPEHEKSFADALDNPDMDYLGIETTTSHFIDPAVGQCGCGETVYLTDSWHGTTECPKCGRWYNAAGQELIPPQYWEENITAWDEY